MIWAGALILAFLVYQLFGTAIGTNLAQNAAEDQLEAIFEESIEELIESGAPVPVGAGGPTADPVNDDMPTLFPEPIRMRVNHSLASSSRLPILRRSCGRELSATT